MSNEELGLESLDIEQTHHLRECFAPFIGGTIVDIVAAHLDEENNAYPIIIVKLPNGRTHTILALNSNASAPGVLESGIPS